MHGPLPKRVRSVLADSFSGGGCHAAEGFFRVFGVDLVEVEPPGLSTRHVLVGCDHLEVRRRGRGDVADVDEVAPVAERLRLLLALRADEDEFQAEGGPRAQGSLPGARGEAEVHPAYVRRCGRRGKTLVDLVDGKTQKLGNSPRVFGPVRYAVLPPGGPEHTRKREHLVHARRGVVLRRPIRHFEVEAQRDAIFHFPSGVVENPRLDQSPPGSKESEGSPIPPDETERVPPAARDATERVFPVGRVHRWHGPRSSDAHGRAPPAPPDATGRVPPAARDATERGDREKIPTWPNFAQKNPMRSGPPVTFLPTDPNGSLLPVPCSHSRETSSGTCEESRVKKSEKARASGATHFGREVAPLEKEAMPVVLAKPSGVFPVPE
ncbi:MAG: hypothetical protein KatS3mg076_2585 [Candidatus Binatia bacterium]|nr:MAG: hypothetical protein KatS3mg076_2585 [Candidatus Binatia bacterium]